MPQDEFGEYERTLLAELEDQKRKSGKNNSDHETTEATLAEIRRRITEMQEGNRNSSRSQSAGGELLTGDSAPVNLYDAIGNQGPRRK